MYYKSHANFDFEISKKSALIGGQPIIYHMEIEVETEGLECADTQDEPGEYIPKEIIGYKIKNVMVEICNDGENGWTTEWSDFSNAPKDVQKLLEDLIDSSKDFEDVFA